MSAASIIGFLGLAALAAAYLLLFLRHGREYRMARRSRYLSDPDALGLPPALVGHVWRMGRVSAHDVSATILDLVDRAWIELDDVSEPRHLILRDGGKGSPMAHEQVLLTLLFGDAGSDGRVAIADLERYSRDEGEEFWLRMSEFKLAIAAWASEQGVFEEEGQRAVPRAVLLGWLTAVWTLVMTLAARSVLLLIVGIVLSASMYVLTRSMWRRSKTFARIHDDAEALRRYLEDFGRMHEKSAGEVVLWSRYLVFAEEFGMAGEVRSQLLQGTGDSIGLFGSLTFVLDALPIPPSVAAVASPNEATLAQGDDADGGDGGQ